MLFEINKAIGFKCLGKINKVKRFATVRTENKIEQINMED